MIVAFSLFIILGIKLHLETDGVVLDFQELSYELASLFFIFHQEDIKVQSVMEGITAFRFVIEKDGENLKEWNDILTNQLIYKYILQWTTNEKNLKDIDFIPLFGKMLSSLLSTAENL